MKPIIEVKQVSKQYRLGTVGTGSLNHDINRWWHRLRGKEDPYLRIGETNDRSQKGNSDYVWALRDIDFTVQPGEVLGIIGRNGAGKSTLLKILSRITAPTTGEYILRGRVASLLEVGTGMHPELTGRENIYLNGAILGMRRKEIDRKLDAIVDFSGVERYLDTPVKRYSSGMHVRLGFAVAAHLEPDILIVDEVLAVGDAEFQKKCIGKMQDVSNQEGRTVLFVSHNMASIQNLCSRALLIERGSIKNSGLVTEVINQYHRVEYDQQVHLKDRKDRSGNRKFIFSGIEFLNEKDSLISTIYSGEPFTLKITYEILSNLKVSKILIAIDFKDLDGVTVFAFMSDEMGFILKQSTDNSFYLKIPKLMLRAGQYAVRLFATYGDTNPVNHCDDIENAAELTVLTYDYWNTGRVLRPATKSFMEGKFCNKDERYI